MIHDISYDISFCSTIIDLQNEIFIMTNIVYHSGVKLQILFKTCKKMEHGNFKLPIHATVLSTKLSKKKDFFKNANLTNLIFLAKTLKD